METFWILWDYIFWPTLHVTEKSLVQVFLQWCGQKFEQVVLAWQDHWDFRGALILERSLYAHSVIWPSWLKVLLGNAMGFGHYIWKGLSCTFFILPVECIFLKLSKHAVHSSLSLPFIDTCLLESMSLLPSPTILFLLCNSIYSLIFFSLISEKSHQRERGERERLGTWQGTWDNTWLT